MSLRSLFSCSLKRLDDFLDGGDIGSLSMVFLSAFPRFVALKGVLCMEGVVFLLCVCCIIREI